MASPHTPHENPEQNPEALKKGVRDDTAQNLSLLEHAINVNLGEIPKNLGTLNLEDGKYKAPAKNAE